MTTTANGWIDDVPDVHLVVTHIVPHDVLQRLVHHSDGVAPWGGRVRVNHPARRVVGDGRECLCPQPGTGGQIARGGPPPIRAHAVRLQRHPMRIEPRHKAVEQRLGEVPVQFAVGEDAALLIDPGEWERAGHHRQRRTLERRVVRAEGSIPRLHDLGRCVSERGP
eukprot:CAMPEP_0206304664 /NCGR_PEP_ID=MMETSP0106_2-20121207/9862_1 /ASSEMBLY_ACC=CAM_ASM_000206 /TAXON_ID=81532 /ORGANISM="Acanthoeca-like sp., Strain 10tr" /LENGTH=165 /DNA_ID=CAMNT_0053735483 /DNA_START=65 /DNA_END=560 /DNA_ORIENTATION=-